MSATNIKKIIVIQDVKTKEYYWNNRGMGGFRADIDDAETFPNKEKAEEIIAQAGEEDNYAGDSFDGRYLEIKEYIVK